MKSFKQPENWQATPDFESMPELPPEQYIQAAEARRRLNLMNHNWSVLDEELDSSSDMDDKGRSCGMTNTVPTNLDHLPDWNGTVIKLNLTYMRALFVESATDPQRAIMLFHLVKLVRFLSFVPGLYRN